MENPSSDIISCSSLTQLITSDVIDVNLSDVRVRYRPNINPILTGGILIKDFPVCMFYVI